MALTKHLLATAVANANRDDARAEAFAQRVVGIGYDLASMTWPGWNEVGIEITDAVREAGLAAARLVVAVADQCDAARKTRHANYWMLGAHLLADGDTAGARAAWETSIALSDHNANDTRAWIALADAVDTGDHAPLDGTLAALEAQGGDAAATAAQVRTAMDVFLA